MNIVVFGAASNDIDKKYFPAVEEIGKRFAEKGYDLTYGAGAGGLMGAAARGFMAGGRNAVAVVPHFLDKLERVNHEYGEIILTDTLRQRKQIMDDRSDAIVICPGGVGTFDELFEVLTLKNLGQHNKPIAIFNMGGYYDKLMEFLFECVEKGFVSKDIGKLFLLTDSIDELVEYVDSNLK